VATSLKNQTMTIGTDSPARNFLHWLPLRRGQCAPIYAAQNRWERCL
jgi:hypothetical protein